MTKDAILEEVERLSALMPRWMAWRKMEEKYGPRKTYHAYLQSDEWKAKRDAVLKRAGGKCEACLTRDAWQVHHITYEHKYMEPCYELRAVCDPCHEAITGADNEALRRRT